MNAETRTETPPRDATGSITLRQRLQAAKENRNESSIKYCCTMFGIFIGTMGCQIISLIFTLLPIVMIYFGAKNLQNCPISKFIPLFLLIQGICTLIDQSLHYMECRITDQESLISHKSQLGRIFDTFVVIWFVIGSVYVYQIYEPNYNKSDGEYCDKTTYLFAFWSITILYICIGVFILSGFLILLIMCCINIKKSQTVRT